jgi:tellurite resistance protein
MGLIGKVFGAITGLPTASDRALLDVLCLAAAADGDVSQLELGYALEIALDLPGFQRVSRKRLQEMLQERVVSARLQSPAAMMKQIAARSGTGEPCEQAYTLAAVIQYVDGRVTDQETALLTALRTALAVSEARAQQILAEVHRELQEAQRSNLMNG